MRLIMGLFFCFYSFHFCTGQTLTPLSNSGLYALGYSGGSSFADVDNDTFPDLLMTGVDDFGNVYTLLYKNNADQTFTDFGFNLDPVFHASSSWNDLNNDGFLDLIISGTLGSGNPQSKIYINSNGILTPSAFTIINLNNGAVNSFDFNNDGRIDIVINGINQLQQRVTQLYKNTGNGLIPVITSLPNLSHGSIAIIDYDNDGRTDLLMTGITMAGQRYTSILKNNSGEFIEINNGFARVAFSSVSIHDYNSDGFADIIYSGIDSNGNPSTHFYINNGQGVFNEKLNSGLPFWSESTIRAGDFNNDGLADIAISGSDNANQFLADIYLNNGDETFSAVNSGLDGVISGSLQPIDLDKNGDLDILISGYSDLGTLTKLYMATTAGANTKPDPPGNLFSMPTHNSVTLSWDSGGDLQTPAGGLTYNIYVGKSPGDQSVVSSLSNGSGTYYLSDAGRLQSSKIVVMDSLPEGIYYWSVQAIDNHFTGSVFAPEQTFVICHDIDLGPDMITCMNDSIHLLINDPLSIVNWYSQSKGLLLANTHQLKFKVTEKDTLIVEVSKSIGCTLKDSLVVDIYPFPEINLGPDTTICFEEFLKIQLSGYDSVNWFTTSGNFKINNNNNLEYQVTEKDTIIAEVFNSAKCVNYDTLVIDFNPLPKISIADTSICFQSHFSKDLSQFASINWSTSKDLTIHNSPIIDFPVLNNDTLWIEVFDKNNCINYDTAFFNVKALPVINPGNDTSICYGETLSLELNGLDSANWYLAFSGNNKPNQFALDYQALSPEIIVAEGYTAGCVNYDTIQVNINPLPQFTIGNDSSICFGDSINLNIDGFTHVSWFDSQGSLLKNNSPDYWYKAITSETLVARATDSLGCTNYDSMTITKLSPPVFTPIDPVSLCYGDSVLLVIPEYNDVSWYSSRSGLLQKNKNALQFLFAESDTLLIEVSDSNGCTGYDSAYVTVHSNPKFDLADTLQFCYNDSAHLSIKGYTSVTWSSSNTGLVTSTEIQFPVQENFWLTTKVMDSLGCMTRDSVFFISKPLPKTSLGPDISVCPEEFVKLGIIPGMQNINWYHDHEKYAEGLDSIQITAKTDMQIMVDAVSAAGCFNADTVEIHVYNLPEIEAGPDSIICYLSGIRLGPDLIDPLWHYEWSENVAEKNNPNPMVFPDHNDVFILTVKDNNSCMNADTVYLRVNPPTISFAGTDKEICFGESVEIGPGEISNSYFPLSFDWSPSDDLNNSTLPNPVATPDSSTIFRLIVQAGECIPDTSYVNITVHPLPALITNPDVSIGKGESITLTASGAEYYFWQPFDGLSSDHESRPTASPAFTTTYQITGVSLFGCSSTAEITVYVRNDIFIPDLFTPNSDGINDYFKIYGSGIQDLSLKILTINGNVLYESASVEDLLNNGWNGMYNGETIESGNYIWIISGQFFDGTPVTFQGKRSGVIKLIR